MSARRAHTVRHRRGRLARARLRRRRYKRLEAGHFQVLTTTSDPQGIEIEYWQLVQLLDGIDLNTGRRRKRYRRSG